MKNALLLLGCIAILGFLLLGCMDDGVTDDVPRFGDGVRIGEALEKATCEASGGHWSNRTNTCRK